MILKFEPVFVDGCSYCVSGSSSCESVVVGGVGMSTSITGSGSVIIIVTSGVSGTVTVSSVYSCCSTCVPSKNSSSILMDWHSPDWLMEHTLRIEFA
jgi:hypothetical protein